MPAWMLERWDAHYGRETADAIARAALEEPEKYVRISPAGERRQDIGAQQIVPLLDLLPGQRFLDVCAAPGNKTAQALESGVDAVACDVHFDRLGPLKMLTPKLVVLDATTPLPFSARFDRILVDAPCSGTGTLARNPEIKWRLTPADLDDLHRRQVAILANARQLLAPGGILVYATCSLEREENDDVAGKAALARLPGIHPGDGFYAAVINQVSPQMTEIVPSILSADFARLAEEISRVERAGARILHLDVMDGHFVANLTIGPPVVESIRKATKLHLDCHLMIENPERYVEAFVKAGANSVSVHYEAARHLDGCLNLIKKAGAMAGVVLNPATPVEVLDDVLGVADYVLLMSVNPGFGGQKLIPYVLDKVRRLDGMRRTKRLTFPIEIDGGVHKENLAEVVRAGCDWIVTGSAIFHSPDPETMVSEMRAIAAGATAMPV
jgi:ribulose-phosphate 3-epimerase